LPIQYADFAAWQRQTLQGPAFSELLGYWQERLHGFKVIEIPTDRPRPAIRSVRGSQQNLRLDEALCRGLLSLGRRESSTLFMTLLAAWKVALWLWTGEEDITLTTNIANRDRSEVEPLIGLFSNVLVLRTDLSGDPTFSELLARVREATLADFAHQDLPFVEILRRARPGRVAGYNELFPVGFALQNFPVRPVALPDLSVRMLDLESGTVPRDLILVASEDGGEIEASLLYRQDIFSAATITDLLLRFGELVRTLVDAPGEQLSSLALELHARGTLTWPRFKSVA
jgi:non-ribosomal peptide synthetase component F